MIRFDKKKVDSKSNQPTIKLTTVSSINKTNQDIKENLKKSLEKKDS